MLKLALFAQELAIKLFTAFISAQNMKMVKSSERVTKAHKLVEELEVNEAAKREECSKRIIAANNQMKLK